jgi:thioredoxin 1
MANPHVHLITDDNFATEVLGSSEPVLLDFTAEWCGPCKRLAPIVDEIARDTVGSLKVGKIDIDASPAVSARFGIRGAPTVIVFKDGREVARQVGVTSKQRLLALVPQTPQTGAYSRSDASTSAR